MNMNLLEAWLNSPYVSASDKTKIQQLPKDMVEEHFLQHIDFGTGGIRGKMGLGPNRLNPYTVARIAEGIGEVLVNQRSKNIVAISYDTRLNAIAFAQIVAKVLSNKGIQVYLSNEFLPTPLLSFATRYFKANLGIMITASHNPSDDNGIKLYDQEGCQLVPSQAKEFQVSMERIPAIVPLPTGNQDHVVSFGQAVIDAYQKLVLQLVDHHHPQAPLLVAFTSLQGTGFKIAKPLIEALGHHYLPVDKECIPDGRFQYVTSSNPEDPAAYLGIEGLYQTSPFDIGFLTDPDADRLGVVVSHQGKLTRLTGNQVGAILIHHLGQNTSQIKSSYVASTIVSSDLGKKIAKSYGLDVVETLTGFKYIGEQIAIRKSQNFLFGYEESFGFLIRDFVRDKDAFQPLVVLLDLVIQLKKNNQSLVDYLEQIHQTYGYYQDSLLTKTIRGSKGIQIMQEFVRSVANTPLGRFGNLTINRIENYQLGIVRDANGDKPLTLEKSDVIKFHFQEGGWVVFRPSGTEPKLKIYLSLTSKNPQSLSTMFAECQSVILDLLKTLD
jgi:phosphoglucomutase